jgi:hypothetical protein
MNLFENKIKPENLDLVKVVDTKDQIIECL